MYRNSKEHYHKNRQRGADAQLVRILSDRWRKRGIVVTPKPGMSGQERRMAIKMGQRKYTIVERFRRIHNIGRYEDLGGNDG